MINETRFVIFAPRMSEIYQNFKGFLYCSFCDITFYFGNKTKIYSNAWPLKIKLKIMLKVRKLRNRA
jgi:hypothetical protein